MDNIYCISRFNNNNTCIEHNDTIAVFSFPKRIWAIIEWQIVYICHFAENKLALPYKWWYLTTLAPARTLLNCNGITPTSPFFGFLSFEVFSTAQKRPIYSSRDRAGDSMKNSFRILIQATIKMRQMLNMKTMSSTVIHLQFRPSILFPPLNISVVSHWGIWLLTRWTVSFK